MERRVRYGVGEQSFEVMRTGGFNYVDKTQYIEQILKGGQYFFYTERTISFHLRQTGRK